MAQRHQGKCFGFILLLCFFSSVFARRVLKDLPMMAPIKLDLIHPGMVSLSAQDHELFSLEPEPDHQPQSMDLEDKVKRDYKEKLDDKEKIDHVVKPGYEEMLDDKEKIDHVVKPGYKEMLDDKEKIDHVVKPGYMEMLDDKEKIEAAKPVDAHHTTTHLLTSHQIVPIVHLSFQDKTSTCQTKGTMTEALAPASSEMHV